MGHHHAVEPSGRKRPGPRLDVRNANLDPADSSERNERRLIAIDSDDGETQGAQIAQMPAMAAGDVENAPAGPDQRGPAAHPGRWRLDFMRLRGHGLDYLAAQPLAPSPCLVQHSEGIFPRRERPWHPTLGRSAFPANPAPRFRRGWTRPPNLRSRTPCSPIALPAR